MIASDRRFSPGWLPPILGLVALVMLLAAPTSASAALQDAFAGAGVEGGGSRWGEHWLAGLDSATKEPGEPDHAGQPGGHSVWMGWAVYEDQIIEAKVCADEDADPVVAVYTGTAVDQLTEVASDGVPEDGCGGDMSWARFAAKAGTTYWIAVDVDGNPGFLDLQVNRLAANDNFADAQVLDPLPSYEKTDPSLATMELGEPDHGGRSNSVWYEWTPTVHGHASFGGCDYWDVGRIDVYTGAAIDLLAHLATGRLGDASCKPENMAQLDAKRGTTYMVAVTGYTGRDGDLDLDFRFEVPPRAFVIPSQALGSPAPLQPVVNPAPPKQAPKCRRQPRRAFAHRAKPCARKKHRGKRHSQHGGQRSPHA